MPQIQLCSSPRPPPSYTAYAAGNGESSVTTSRAGKMEGKCQSTRPHPPKHSKTNRDTDLSYPTTLPGVIPGTKPDQTAPSAAHTPRRHAAAARVSTAAAQAPRVSYRRCPPTQRSRPPAAPDDPKNKTNKTPQEKRERSTAQGRRSLGSQFPLLAAGSSTRRSCSTRRGTWPEIQPPGARRSAGCSRFRW